MKRDAVYYVLPVGKAWLVRAIGSAGNSYATLEQALAEAERLTSLGARVRVLSRPDAAPISTTRPLARTTDDPARLGPALAATAS